MRIAPASAKAVDYACKHFHYAKTVPQSLYAFNVYNDKDEWCGCIVYGGGANNNLAKSFGLNSGEVLELERVALNGKQEYTSKAVSMTLRELHHMNPLCRIVVSYADHRQGHLGTIYQATNWIYLGKVITGDTQYYYKGKWVHHRTMRHAKNFDELVKTLPKRKNSNKFKYIWVFDKKERRKWQEKALPYPKDADLT